MRFVPRAVLAGGLGFAAAFLVACGGGSGLLSSDQNGKLQSQLDRIQSAVTSGNCQAATSAADSFSTEVQNLPPTVNSTLRSGLSQDANTVGTLAAKDCQAATTTTPTSTSTSTTNSTTTTTTTKSATTTPTSTSTTPTSTSTSTSSSTATTPPTSGTSSTGGSGGAGLAPGASGGAGTGTGP
jgi:hypothetical protein